MISDGNVKYIYSTSAENNNVVNDLIKNYNIENIIINSMYSIDGGITNTNENYFTIMNNNLELFKKELYKQRWYYEESNSIYWDYFYYNCYSVKFL